MKAKASKWLELVIESINYIIINYALSNMAMILKSNPLFILFFASEVWIMSTYWRKAVELTKSKLLSAFLLVACFAIHIAMVYFLGRFVGDIVPFKQ